jgi:hypothetical protein
LSGGLFELAVAYPGEECLPFLCRELQHCAVGVFGVECCTPQAAVLGGLWLRYSRVRSGLIMVVVPSGFSLTVQPHSWMQAILRSRSLIGRYMQLRSAC